MIWGYHYFWVDTQNNTPKKKGKSWQRKRQGQGHKIPTFLLVWCILRFQPLIFRKLVCQDFYKSGRGFQKVFSSLGSLSNHLCLENIGKYHNEPQRLFSRWSTRDGGLKKDRRKDLFCQPVLQLHHLWVK